MESLIMRAESPQTSATYLRWAYLPVSVAILAVVAATDVTPAVFAVVVAMAGFTAERPQPASRLRERQRRVELGTTFPSTRGRQPRCSTSGPTPDLAKSAIGRGSKRPQAT